uniref:CKLF like MARVEL transmembrane domain containing 5 n=1 Tax=Pseudonaja textilis TaxID=8673 RepID=A0A670YR59_PSETE
TPGARSPPRRQDEEPADGEVGGFALDKEFLRSPKGIVMGVELDFLRCISAAIIFIVVGFAVIATNHGGSAVSAFVFSLILIGIFCLDAYKTYQAEMRSEE